MAKLLYFVLLTAVVWKAYADLDDEDKDFIPDATQNNREIKCGKYYAQYPNPEDCSSYIVCQNGQKTIKSCPSGQHYNFNTIRCVEPCEAYCNKTLSCECKWSTCGLDDVCFLEQIVGGCRDRVARYFFNKRTGQCERFGYSGCMGNENNFETEEECLQKCRKAKPIPSFRCLTMNGLFPNPDNCITYFQCSGGKPQLKTCEAGLHYSDKSKTCEKPCDAYCDKSLSCECKWPTCGLDDLCFLPPEVGPCRAGFYNYYFNRRTGKCEEFLFGGCQGNKNNFQKKEECEKACTKSEEPPLEESTEPTTERGTEPISEESTEPPVDDISDPPAEEVLDPSFECKEDGLYPHSENCRSFIKCSKGVPTLNSCQKKFHFNNETKKCETPCKAHCDRTYACQCKWPTCGTNALCFLPAKPGPCNGKFKRFYFNKRSGECKTFNYGGCQGNENNFHTKHACERKCKHSLDICKLPYKTGPCKGKFERYYFNFKKGKCQKFHFGGCNGNENNFKTLEECETSCSQKKHQEAYQRPECTKENKKWPNYDDCGSYYQCSNEVANLFKCPDGQHYSIFAKTCVAPCEAHCDHSLACDCGWWKCNNQEAYQRPDCTKENEKWPNYDDCGSYYKCSNEIANLFKCPDGQHYSIFAKTCVAPCQAHCDRSLACDCGWWKCNKQETSEPSKCPKETRTWPNTEDCKSYYQCTDGIDKLVFCPSGQHYSVYEKKCTDPCHAFCDFSLACQCKWGPCQTKAYPLLGCNQENSTWTNIDDCSTYYQCSGGETQLVKCPSGQHYNLALKRCTDPCDAFCEPSLACKCGWPTCKKSEDFTCVKDGLFKDPESCSSYIHCVKGEKYDMPCPTGYHFNEKSKLCEAPSKAQCQEYKANSENICRLPPEAGICNGSYRKYYFNRRKGECQTFIYGGCGGNGNNFESRAECQKSCLVNADSTISEPICTEDGVRSDFESCGRYIQCSNGREEIVYCPSSLHFNEATKECDSPCDARCDMSLAMECGWPMGGEKIADPECAEDGVFTDLSSCSHYIHCSNGQKSLKSCPPSLHFNEKTKECDSPCDARCDPSLALECGWPMGTGDEHCPEHEHSILRQNCSAIKDVFAPCPPGCLCDKGYARNSDGKCISAEEFERMSGQSRDSACDCGSKGSCTLDSSGKKTCKCFEGALDYQGFCYGIRCGQRNGYMRYPGSIKKYIKCKNNKPTVEECPEDQFYHYIQQKCVDL